jgi:hypothetical protein
MKTVCLVCGIVVVALLAANLGGCPLSSLGSVLDLFGTGTTGGNTTGTSGDNTGNSDTGSGDTGNSDTGNGNTNNSGNGNETTGSSGSTDLDSKVVKTGINMHCQAAIRVSEDLIVYGTGSIAGVDYIKPAAGDTAGRGIPGGSTYHPSAFAVAGKKIALVKDFLITIYDTETGTATEILETDLRLDSVLTGQYAVKNLHGEGNYFVVVCNTSTVTDGKLLKVIDVSGTTPTVLSFGTDAADYANGITQVAVDGTHVVVSTSDDKFYKYDITQPDAEPLLFDVSGDDGIDADTYWETSNLVVIYRDYNVNDQSVRVLDMTGTDGPIKLTENPSAAAVAIGSTKFCYLLYRDSEDADGNHMRSAVGTVPGPGATPAGNTEVDGSTGNNNFVGWGQTCAVTPTSKYIFLAGWEAMGQGEYLQYSTGGDFMVLADPSGIDAWGCPGTDVQLSDKICAFKTAAETTSSCDETVVGYILLP